MSVAYHMHSFETNISSSFSYKHSRKNESHSNVQNYEYGKHDCNIFKFLHIPLSLTYIYDQMTNTAFLFFIQLMTFALSNVLLSIQTIKNIGLHSITNTLHLKLIKTTCVSQLNYNSDNLFMFYLTLK